MLDGVGLAGVGVPWAYGDVALDAARAVALAATLKLQGASSDSHDLELANLPAEAVVFLRCFLDGRQEIVEGFGMLTARWSTSHVDMARDADGLLSRWEEVRARLSARGLSI